MRGRYEVHEGIVVGRKAWPDGSVHLRLVTPEGGLEAKVRQGVRANARGARASLFHHIRFQTYRKGGGVPSLTEVELVGRLFGLEEPQRFLQASFLGELAYRVASPDVAPQAYPLLVSGLRGIAKHANPQVPLVWAGWRMVRAAGLAPRLEAGRRLGGVRGVVLGAEEVEALGAILQRPGKEAAALLEAGKAVEPLYQALRAYAQETVGPLLSLQAL